METIITIRKKSVALKYLIGIAKEFEKKDTGISVSEKSDPSPLEINGILIIPPKSTAPIDFNDFLGKYPDFPALEEIRKEAWR